MPEELNQKKEDFSPEDLAEDIFAGLEAERKTPKETQRLSSSKFSFKRLIIIVLLVIFLLILGYGGYTQWSKFTSLTKIFKSRPKIVPTVISQPAEEAPVGSMPVVKEIDNDKDGLPDREEMSLGTDPQNPDTDNDGLTDKEEVKVYQTDPLNPDTDGDGVLDGQEVRQGFDPINPNPEARLLDLEKEIKKLK